VTTVYTALAPIRFNDILGQRVMRGRRSSLAATALLIATTTGTQADPGQHLCTVEQAAGLHYDSQTNAWRPQSFATGKKYVLRRLNDDDRDKKKGKWWALLSYHPKANWAFFQFEKDMMPLSTCEYYTSDTLPSFTCRRGILDGSFDMDSRRFEIVSNGGYPRVLGTVQARGPWTVQVGSFTWQCVRSHSS
jgi:hypothetical protein